MSGTSSVVRAVQLLNIVADGGREGIRLSDIAQKAELHIATTRRILQTLASEDFLHFSSASKRYAIGPALFSCAAKGDAWFAKRDIFIDALTRLAEMTDDTLLLSVRTGNDVLCIARKEGRFPIKVLALEAGTRRPLGVGSGSVAILALLDEEERNTLVAGNKKAFGDFNLETDDVREMIEFTRAHGYSFNPAKMIPGVWGVGVPFIEGSRVVGSISLTAIAERLSKVRRQEVVNLIRGELLKIGGVSVPDIRPET